MDSKGKMSLDAIDHKLLELLQENSRMSQSDLAAKVGLSQPSIAERVHKLERLGVILGYMARVDARALGKGITAFIGVAIEHPRFNTEFARQIMDVSEVLECHHVTGGDSYLLKVKTEDTESLDRLISERIRTIPGVTSTRTTVVMSSVKEDCRIFAATGPDARGKDDKSGGLTRAGKSVRNDQEDQAAD